MENLQAAALASATKSRNSKMVEDEDDDNVDNSYDSPTHSSLAIVLCLKPTEVL